MQKEIFRKNSLERLSSPDKLNEYIRVSRPSVWIILGAIIVLIAAVAFWACTAVVTPEGLRPIDFFLN